MCCTENVSVKYFYKNFAIICKKTLLFYFQYDLRRFSNIGELESMVEEHGAALGNSDIAKLHLRRMSIEHNTTTARRHNALILFQEHLSQAVAQGHSAKGIEQSFAKTIQISPSLWSQIKTARPIGDKLARQMERLCDRPTGWLDQVHSSTQSLEQQLAQQRFVQLALGIWNISSEPERKRIMQEWKTRLRQTKHGKNPPAA